METVCTLYVGKECYHVVTLKQAFGIVASTLKWRHFDNVMEAFWDESPVGNVRTNRTNKKAQKKEKQNETK